MAKFLGLYSVIAGVKGWACQVAVKRTQMAFQTITGLYQRFMHLENWNVSNFFMHHFRYVSDSTDKDPLGGSTDKDA